jgi:hypothetical protein
LFHELHRRFRERRRKVDDNRHVLPRESRLNLIEPTNLTDDLLPSQRSPFGKASEGGSRCDRAPDVEVPIAASRQQHIRKRVKTVKVLLSDACNRRSVHQQRENIMAKSCLVVRAEVIEKADRDPFDRWYATDHLPLAVKTFGARRGWRCWSRTDPAVHYAFYQFDRPAQVEAATAADKISR